MAVRYFVSIGRSAHGALTCPKIDSGMSSHHGLTGLDPASPVTVATNGQAPLTFPNGLIVGEIYRNGDFTVVARLTDDEIDRISRSSGQSLIEEFWGSYVAVLGTSNGAAVHIIRAPFGELPCLFVETSTMVVAASDPALLVDLAGYRPSIDWVAIGRHFACRDLRYSETCLAGVRELHGGDALIVGATVETTALWTPWKFAHRNGQFRDKADAIAAVRKATLYAVRARSFGRRSVLLLSGGIDSSIVAAALAAAGADFACLTLTTRDETGNELDYARAVSERVGEVLHIFRREVSRVDLRRSAAARQARPVARSFAQETRRAVFEAADRIGADLFLGGGGGDNVFCSLQSGGPAADLLLTRGPGRQFFTTAASIAEIASVPVAAVVRDAVKRAFHLRKPQQASIDTRLLGPAALANGGSAPSHPWFAPPRSILPGKAGHVRLLAYAQSYVESFDPLDTIPMSAPLLAQPVVEACLRVPSWFWFEGGRNRMIARHAFQRELPSSIFKRRSKGSPESFVGEIFERNRPSIREMLLDGGLAANGIIDRAAVEELLKDRRPAHGTGFMRLVEFADTEAWMSAWLDGSSSRLD